MLKVSYEKNGQTFEKDFDTMPVVAKEYLAQYGWQQALADSHASVITKLMTDLADVAKDEGKEFPAKGSAAYKALAESEEVAKLAKPKIAEAIEKRIERIMKGEMATRETDPMAVECRKIALAIIAESSKTTGTALPDKKSEVWKKLVEAVMGSDNVVAEAKKRLARPLPKVDLSKFLA